MRLDKYLKVCRIIKRRTVSKDIISFGQVFLNGRKAKPASNVNVNDLITMTLGQKEITIKALIVSDKVKKEEAINMYEVVNEKTITED